MGLREYEKDVQLYYNSKENSAIIREIARQLNEKGFLVYDSGCVRSDLDLSEPVLATAFGDFFGFRSIFGFINGHKTIVNIYRKTRKELKAR
ncbi:MAG: hypothetical protein AUJ75_03920 [Candidatus Omnitrophica bacterium CG1_02_49_10]|nr:MAG: hypothetical protein AUJ75_03920 [Candidatus Omnitrophica bacterium CG1_02_49_10]